MKEMGNGMDVEMILSMFASVDTNGTKRGRIDDICCIFSILIVSWVAITVVKHWNMNNLVLRITFSGLCCVCTCQRGTCACVCTLNLYVSQTDMFAKCLEKKTVTNEWVTLDEELQTLTLWLLRWWYDWFQWVSMVEAEVEVIQTIKIYVAVQFYH